MSDGFEPHGTIGPRVPHPSLAVVLTWGRGGVPGVWDRVGGREGYTGYLPSHPRTLIFNIFKAKGPTYGQMRLNYEVSVRFLR